MTMVRVLHQQSASCTALGSPFMGQLLFLLADSWRKSGNLADFCASFEGDIGPSGYSLPLRLAGALHALVLTGRDPDLAAVYPPHETTDIELEEAIWPAIRRHEAFILDWMTSAPQTNEVRRSAVLIPSAHWLANHIALPFVTSELGASAGLNMAWDKFALSTPAGRLGPDTAALTLTPDWQGDMPPAAPITVTQRSGVDLNPLDPHDQEQRQRLLAYLWPDQPYRAELTLAAIAARAGTVDRDDAVAWLKQRLETPHPGHLHLIYHTIAWQYFPQDAQSRGTALIEAAGAAATEDAPLAWLRFEADGESPGAGITLRLWPGDQQIALGRADYHGRWVNWSPTKIR